MFGSVLPDCFTKKAGGGHFAECHMGLQKLGRLWLESSAEGLCVEQHPFWVPIVDTQMSNTVIAEAKVANTCSWNPKEAILTRICPRKQRSVHAKEKKTYILRGTPETSVVSFRSKPTWNPEKRYDNLALIWGSGLVV